METDIERTIAWDGFFAYSIPTAYWNGNLDPFFHSSRDLSGRKNISHTLLSLPLKSFVNFQKEVVVFSFLRSEQIWQIVSLIHIYTSTLILKPLGQPISVGGSGPEFRSQIGAQTEKLRKFASFQEINALSGGTGEGYIYRGKSRDHPTSYIRCTSPQNRFPNRFDTCFQCSLQTLGLNYCFRWATYNEVWCFFAVLWIRSRSHPGVFG